MKFKIFLMTLISALSFPTFAQNEPFIGEIKWVPYNFAPRGWALCDGQTLPISSNSALFSLLGTTYGGDGRTTFNLPDVRGRVMVHEGNGPGLSNYPLGSKGGTENVSLNQQQIPRHTHALKGTKDIATEMSPEGNYLAGKERTNLYSSTASEAAPLNTLSVENSGGGQAHENRPPYVALNCIFALQGVFPSRN